MEHMTTQENEHSTQARSLLDACFQEDAKVEATLAIVYEARTANLLAFRAIAGSILASGTLLTPEFAEQVNSADEQIIERLGLPSDD